MRDEDNELPSSATIGGCEVSHNISLAVLFSFLKNYAIKLIGTAPMSQFCLTSQPAAICLTQLDSLKIMPFRSFSIYNISDVCSSHRVCQPHLPSSASDLDLCNQRIHQSL
ncbi:hypothetical protein ACTXT7_005818 [Hymenolepis weldensis]